MVADDPATRPPVPMTRSRHEASIVAPRPRSAGDALDQLDEPADRAASDDDPPRTPRFRSIGKLPVL